MRLWAAVLLAALTWLAGPASLRADERLHEVRPGESLWAIAATTIGDPTLWPALYRANRDQIKDPSVLHPGQRLRIPQIDPATREAVRREAEALAAK